MHLNKMFMMTVGVLIVLSSCALAQTNIYVGNDYTSFSSRHSTSNGSSTFSINTNPYDTFIRYNRNNGNSWMSTSIGSGGSMLNFGRAGRNGFNVTLRDSAQFNPEPYYRYGANPNLQYRNRGYVTHRQTFYAPQPRHRDVIWSQPQPRDDIWAVRQSEAAPTDVNYSRHEYHSETAELLEALRRGRDRPDNEVDRYNASRDRSSQPYIVPADMPGPEGAIRRGEIIESFDEDGNRIYYLVAELNRIADEARQRNERNRDQR